MSYLPTNIIARPAYSSMSGLDEIWGAVKGGVSSAIDFYGQTQQQAGAAAALAAQNQSMQQALATRSSPGISPTVLIAGGLGVVALVLFMTRK